MPYLHPEQEFLLDLGKGWDISDVEYQKQRVENNLKNYKDFVPNLNWSDIRRYFKTLIGACQKLEATLGKTFNKIGDFVSYCREFNKAHPEKNIAVWFYEQTKLFLFGVGSQNRMRYSF